MIKRMPPNDSSVDCRVQAFAEAVLSGEIIAGPDVRNAARRHIKDLETGAGRGLIWVADEAKRVINFFEEVLCLNGGDYEGQPFILAPWQAFVLGSLFGWYMKDGSRRFRIAYIETGKGSGKSPLAAGVGLYGLVADNQPRAEIYAAATKRDQAQVLFRDAVSMVNMSPHLLKRLEQSGRNEKVWNLYYPNLGSFFRTISADEGQSGPRPHIGLLDEVHEHKNSSAVELMRAGTKSNTRALILMITNSGSDKKSVCGQYHDLGVRVCQGSEVNDNLFSFICSLDEDDDPITDEACWPKVNPSLHFVYDGQKDGIPGYKYLREQVQEARGMPAKEAIVRRLNFCQWTQAINPWIGWDVWSQATERVPMSLLKIRPAVAGLDLSSTTDLTAFVLIFAPIEDDPCWRLLPYFWIPDYQLEERIRRDKVPYDVWIKEKHLETTPGRAISKLHVLRRLQSICAFFEVQQIAYDRWRIEDLKELMNEHGIDLPELVPFGQGYQSMGPAVDEFERRLLGIAEKDQPVELLRHDGNPVLTWCAGNAITSSDPAGNRKVDKAKAIGRVDGIVASVMATGISRAVHTHMGKSVYEEGVGL